MTLYGPRHARVCASRHARVCASAPRREFLEGPGVAVGVGEEHELAPRLHVDVAGLDPAFHELLAGGLDIPDHDLDALLRPGRHLSDPGAHHHRARRAWRGERHEPQALVDLMVMVSVKAHLIDVERLGPVDIAHRDSHKLNLPVHTGSLRSRCDIPSLTPTRAVTPSGHAQSRAVGRPGRGVLSAAGVTLRTASPPASPSGSDNRPGICWVWRQLTRCGRSRSSWSGPPSRPTECGRSAGPPRSSATCQRASWSNGSTTAPWRPFPASAKLPPR